jgi:hypothetical protein
MEIIRLESDRGGNVSLDAGWTILDDDDRKMILSKVSSYRERCKSEDYEEIAAAHSRAIEALSKEIAVAIQNLLR